MSNAAASQKVAGGPSPAELDGMRAQANAVIAGPSGKEVVIGEQAQVNGAGEITGYRQRASEFPTVPFPYDKYDTTFDIKQNFKESSLGGQPGTKQWVIPFEKSDAQWMQRKRDASEQADFDQWVARKYNLDDPAQLFMLQQIDPEYTARREEMIDWKVKVAEHYAKLRLRGAKTKEDLKFEWLIETGRLELPEGPIWDPAREAHANRLVNEPSRVDGSAELNIASISDRYQAGLFNPLRFLKNFGWQPRPNARSDIRGNPNRWMTGEAGGAADYTPTTWHRWTNAGPQPRAAGSNSIGAWEGNAFNVR